MGVRLLGMQVEPPGLDRDQDQDQDQSHGPKPPPESRSVIYPQGNTAALCIRDRRLKKTLFNLNNAIFKHSTRV